jgi:hypothetical protein
MSTAVPAASGKEYSMTAWLPNPLRFGDEPAPYRIQFICYNDGAPEPEVIHAIDGLFKDLYAAIDEANRLGPEIRRKARIDGFRVAEAGGPWIAHRFHGEPWFQTWRPA